MAKVEQVAPRAGLLRRLVLRTVRAASEVLYTRFAWAYDAVAWSVSFGRWRAWQQAGLGGLPSGPVLELGHGPGHVLRDRLERGMPTFGVDPSRQMGRMVVHRLRRLALPACVARARAQALPFADQAFDAVLATFPSEYIIDPQTLAETWRVLKREGCLVVIPGIRITPHGLPERVLRLLYTVTGESPSFPGEWLDGFRAQGFSLVAEKIEAPGAEVYRIIASKT